MSFEVPPHSFFHETNARCMFGPTINHSLSLRNDEEDIVLFSLCGLFGEGFFSFYCCVNESYQENGLGISGHFFCGEHPSFTIHPPPTYNHAVDLRNPPPRYNAIGVQPQNESASTPPEYSP